MHVGPGWSLTGACRAGRRGDFQAPLPFGVVCFSRSAQTFSVSGYQPIGDARLTASGCRSRAARRVTPGRRRGRHAPARARPSRWAARERARSAEVLLHAGEAILAILFGSAIARPWGERPACRRTGFSLSLPRVMRAGSGLPRTISPDAHCAHPWAPFARTCLRSAILAALVSYAGSMAGATPRLHPLE